MAIGHPGVLGVTLPKNTRKLGIGHATIHLRTMVIYAYPDQMEQLHGLMAFMWKLKPGHHHTGVSGAPTVTAFLTSVHTIK